MGKKERSTCEFCDELMNYKMSRFGKLYGSVLESRIIYRDEKYVVIPTIGQLFKGSLLILPVNHFETFARIKKSEIPNFMKILSHFTKVASIFGEPVIFEHGDSCCSNLGCGIYHAHIHIVPVPGTIKISDFFQQNYYTAMNWVEVFETLRNVDSYLTFRDTEGNISYIYCNEFPEGHFKSQYFRRALVSHFNLQKSWDWRSYKKIETDVIETVNILREK